jgi:hypothetical protein
MDKINCTDIFLCVARSFIPSLLSTNGCIILWYHTYINAKHAKNRTLISCQISSSHHIQHPQAHFPRQSELLSLWWQLGNFLSWAIRIDGIGFVLDGTKLLLSSDVKEDGFEGAGHGCAAFPEGVEG